MDTHVVRLAPLATLLCRRLATIVSHKRSSTPSRTPQPPSRTASWLWISSTACFYCLCG